MTVQEAYENLREAVGPDRLAALDLLMAAATLPTVVGMDVAEVAKAAAGPRDHYDCDRRWLERFRALCVAQRTEECAKLLELTSAEVLLLAGEMTERELLTVKAVLAERARRVRALGASTHLAVTQAGG